MTAKPVSPKIVPSDGTVGHDAERSVSEIAQRVLRLDSLQTRHSDALDFHELAIWSIREALLAAHAAGAATTAAQPPKEA